MRVYQKGLGSARILLGKSVLTAARERIAWLFDEFEHVAVAFSGGKDSTIVYHLTQEEALRRGRRLTVFFIDQEAEWQHTIDLVDQVMRHPNVDPLWMQMPMHLDNATSYTERFLKCWDPDKPEEWLREKSPLSVKENTYGTDRFGEIFPAVMRKHFKRVALIGGVRAEESPGRMKGMTTQLTYKHATWGKKLGPDHFTFYPVYDWSYSDVWKAIHEHGWKYNEIYDLQYQHGEPLQNMRVSNLHHETAVYCLFYLQEVDPVLYGKLTKRLSGVDSAGKLGAEDYYARNRPPMFNSWREYRDHLIDKLVTDPDWRKNLTATVEKWDKFWEADEGEADKAARVVVSSILCNDYTGTKTHNYEASIMDLERKERKAEEIDAANWRTAGSAYTDKGLPHQYLLAKDDRELCEWLARQIKVFGTWTDFKVDDRWRTYRIYVKNGYRYWMMLFSPGAHTLVNRTKHGHPTDLQQRPTPSENIPNRTFNYLIADGD